MSNKNVTYTLWFAFLQAMSETSWGYTALSAYLRELSGNNTMVGLAEGFQVSLFILVYKMPKNKLTTTAICLQKKRNLLPRESLNSPLQWCRVDKRTKENLADKARCELAHLLAWWLLWDFGPPWLCMKVALRNIGWLHAP